MAGSTAREHVRVALGLAAWPQVAAVFAAGRLSYSKVRAVVASRRSELEGCCRSSRRMSPASSCTGSFGAGSVWTGRRGRWMPGVPGRCRYGRSMTGWRSCGWCCRSRTPSRSGTTWTGGRNGRRYERRAAKEAEAAAAAADDAAVSDEPGAAAAADAPAVAGTDDAARGDETGAAAAAGGPRGRRGRRWRRSGRTRRWRRVTGAVCRPPSSAWRCGCVTGAAGSRAAPRGGACSTRTTSCIGRTVGRTSCTTASIA
jgi:hypothetical protein